MCKKILLIGDSIRKGYDKYVKMAFQGTAEVYYPETNCMFTDYIIRSIYDWRDELKCGNAIDLIHWNAGLWDDLIMPDGKPLIALDLYKENIKRITSMIRVLFPSAKVVFATSTPVQEELFTRYKRYNCDTEQYNQAACEVVTQSGGMINDLYALLKDVPSEYHSDQTHFYTKTATELITNHTVALIEKALNIKAQKLDFDELFHSENKVVGM